jgi:hypothetical protein
MGDSGNMEVNIIAAISKVEKNTNLIKIGGSPVGNRISYLPHEK